MGFLGFPRLLSANTQALWLRWMGRAPAALSREQRGCYCSLASPSLAMFCLGYQGSCVTP